MTAAFPDEIEDALVDCDSAMLFLNLAIERVFEVPGLGERKGGTLVFRLTEDQVDAVVAAKAAMWSAVRTVGRAVHGHYTIGSRE